MKAVQRTRKPRTCCIKNSPKSKLALPNRKAEAPVPPLQVNNQCLNLVLPTAPTVRSLREVCRVWQQLQLIRAEARLSAGEHPPRACLSASAGGNPPSNSGMAARSSKKTCPILGRPAVIGGAQQPQNVGFVMRRRIEHCLRNVGYEARFPYGRAFGKGEHIARLDRELCRVFRSNLSGHARTDLRRPCAREQPNGRLLARAQSTFVRHLGRQRREPSPRDRF